MKVPRTGWEWTFDPDRADGGVVIDHHDGDVPEYRPGHQFTFSAAFWPAAGGDDTGGTAGGDPATGFTAGGDAQVAATAGVWEPVDHIRRYEQVREYDRIAGRYAKKTALDGTVNFSERVPDDAPVDSIIVALEPGPKVEATPGLWVAIDGMADQTRFVQDAARLAIEVTVLARRDEYDTRADIKAALGGDL